MGLHTFFCAGSSSWTRRDSHVGHLNTAKWADDLVGKMRCGMSIQEVEAAAAKTVKPLNRDWGTHFVEDGSTDVWLTFEKNQLKSYQVAWTRGLTIVEKRERVDLCKQR